jgi:hypothetical protein
MIEVYHIQVSKDHLKAMPKEERTFLLLLGYAANQLSMLQKLLMFSSNKLPTAEIEQYLTAAQTQMILRFLIGTLNETWQLITTRFLQNLIGKEYQTRLDQGGKQALANLKRQFGASSLLYTIRNNFSFHYPESDDVEAAFEAACNDADLDSHWNFYVSQYGFNSFYFLSDLIIVHGIGKETRAADLVGAQVKLMQEVGSAVENIFEFSKAFTAAVWLKNFGEEMLAKELISISNAPNLGDVWIPFFVEMKISPDQQKI